MTIDKQAVGQRIKTLRLAQQLSMAALATAVGVAGKSTINDWEKGRTLASQDKLAALAGLLHTSVGFLLHGDLQHYVFNVLKTNGINNPEFNVLLWEYVDLTTTNPNLLSGDVFGADSTTTTPTEKRDSVIDAHIDDAINQILQAVINIFPASDYPAPEQIIKSACDVFRQRIQLIRRTFTGKYNRIVRLLDNVDLYEKLGADPALKIYLDDTTATSGGFEIDHAYQQKMNRLITEFHQQLNAINADYQHALRQKRQN
ncbi:XRE family transcriptional regulator [Lactiplantibacillus garii]|uniref:XRE family transcriptional regulator n=1 Tax=Lactiplantibacillus garii TaxID=2306423 RepID=A0A426D4J8_9LACO|nr:helix-turn-helix transcriptional regulator [Lactiplantibacillus garii]RRK09583.1 XRE family transcriptional regulator [Lactiplantibacillus garii]